MTKILITGGNGYVGKSLYNSLCHNYSVTSVTRNEFDLIDTSQTNQWFSDKHFDVVIHTAIKGGNRLVTDCASVLDENIQMYYNLLANRQHYDKFINIGSGAEIYAPNSPYGLSKRVIQNSIWDKTDFYNLRVYGVFDENEMNTRFIKANITRYINGKDIIILQDKMMDFFYMKDFISTVRYYIDNVTVPKEFECNYNKSLYLSEIANKINELSHHKVAINVTNNTAGDNYTGGNTPIDIKFLGLDMGIKSVYEKLLCNK
jgi:nucleoside-diphosphate-sugar epimerase